MHDLPLNWVVFRLSALGDVVLTTGPLEFWNARYGWRFTVITKEAFVPVFDNNPHVSAVIPAAPDLLHMPRMNAWFSELAARYAGHGFLDLHGTMRSRLLSMRWKGPVLRYPKLSLARRAFLLSGGNFFQDALNAANVPQRYIAAAPAEARVNIPEKSLLPRMYLSDSEKEWGKSFLANLFGDDVLKKTAGCVALHPFAAHAHKAWPREHFTALCHALDEKGIPWFVLGRGDAFFPGDKRDLTNTTSLRESAALLAASSALVSGDSGPMHMGGAVGTPVVALFGPTTREWGFFLSGPRDVVMEKNLDCRPCSLHGKRGCLHNCECLALILPEDILAALEKIIVPLWEG
jgi:ADP-heptose:LPS heptosyltransferase